jgi:hypothetical protein
VRAYTVHGITHCRARHIPGLQHPSSAIYRTWRVPTGSEYPIGRPGLARALCAEWRSKGEVLQATGGTLEAFNHSRYNVLFRAFGL